MKVSLLVKQWDREWVTPQTEQSFSGICFLYWGSFNERGLAFNKGGGNIQDLPRQGLGISQRSIAGLFMSLYGLSISGLGSWGVSINMLMNYNGGLMRLWVITGWNQSPGWIKLVSPGFSHQSNREWSYLLVDNSSQHILHLTLRVTIFLSELVRNQIWDVTCGSIFLRQILKVVYGMLQGIYLRKIGLHTVK